MGGFEVVQFPSEELWARLFTTIVVIAAFLHDGDDAAEHRYARDDA